MNITIKKFIFLLLLVLQYTWQLSYGMVQPFSESYLVEPTDESLHEPFATNYATLTNWAHYCFERLPEHKNEPTFYQSCLTYQDLFQIFTLFQETTESHSRHIPSLWHEEQVSTSITTKFGRSRKEMRKVARGEIIDDAQEPFIQKLNIQPHNSICFVGDIHASIHALLRNLLRLQANNFIDNNWKIVNPNDYLIFLGDFVDRGSYGLECWLTLMLLYIKNPRNVILLRGNHEEVSLWRKSYFTEIKHNFKFSEACTIGDMFKTFCEQLPYALFIICGTHKGKPCIVQCCHGGINPQMDPVFFKDFIEASDSDYAILQGIRLKTPDSIWIEEGTSEFDEGYLHNGFIWSDFTGISSITYQPTSQTEATNWVFIDWPGNILFPNLPLYWVKLQTHWWLFNTYRGAGYLATIQDTRNYFDIYGLAGCFRGHQDQESPIKILLEGTRDPVSLKETALFKYNNFLSHGHCKIPMHEFLEKNTTAPVFTMTTATEARGLDNEGFLIVETAEEFNDWQLNPHIYPVALHKASTKFWRSGNLFKVQANPETGDFSWRPWGQRDQQPPSCIGRLSCLFSSCCTIQLPRFKTVGAKIHTEDL